MTRQLPFHTIPLALGINTNFEPATQGLKTLRSAVNFDGYRQFRAIGKVPGSTKITASALGSPDPIRSLHQFEYSSLSGVRTRNQLAAAGGVLYDVTGGGAEVVWDDPALADEALASAVFESRIYFSSGNQRGLVTGGVKYDGRDTAYSSTGNLGSRWGVMAPGTEPTVLEALDDNTLWTPTAGVTPSDSTTSRDGLGSVQVDFAAVTEGAITQAGLALTQPLQSYVWVFIPPGAIQKLATALPSATVPGVAAVEVRVGDAGLTNSDSFQFGVGELVSGWNLLSMLSTAPDGTSGTGCPTGAGALDTVRLRIVFAASSTQTGFLWDNYYQVDDGRVTPTAAAGDGELLGSFSYRSTFLTEFGLESNGGTVGAETPAKATGTLSTNTNVEDGETVTIGSITYVFKTSLGTPAYQVLIGSTQSATMANLAAAINDDGPLGTEYSAATVIHPDVEATSASGTLTATARLIGSAGNAIVTRQRSNETMLWAAATLTGGSSGFASASATTSVATGVVTIAVLPSNNDTVTIGNIVYTFKTALTGAANEVLLAGGASGARANLRYAINDNGEGVGAEGTEWGTGTQPHPNVVAGAITGAVRITARVAGTDGNTLVTTETFTSGSNSWADATLLGGQDGQNIDLTTIPVSADPQVIARRIYRDFNDDRIFRFVAQIDNNVDTTFTDDVPDASLGQATMPIAGDDEIDHSPPERMRDIAVFNNRIFGISGDDPTVLLVSDVSLPEAFPIVAQLALDEELVGLRTHNTQGLLLYGRTRTFILAGAGTAAQPFQVELFNGELGAVSFRTIVDALGFNVALKNWEMYLVDNPGTVNPTRGAWLINGPVLNQFSGAAQSDLEAAFMAHDRSRYRILTFVGSTIHSYQYGALGFQEITGDGPGIDPKDMRMAAWWTLSLPITVTAAATIEVDATGSALWIGGSDGHIYELQDVTKASYANAGSTAAITSSLETHAVPLGPSASNTSRGRIETGDSVTGRGEPRFLEINSESTSGITWSATVSILSDSDGTVLGTSTFDLVCPAGKSVVCVPIPPAGILGSWCRIALTNTSSTADGIIRHLRLYYIGHASRRGVRST